MIFNFQDLPCTIPGSMLCFLCFYIYIYTHISAKGCIIMLKVSIEMWINCSYKWTNLSRNDFQIGFAIQTCFNENQVPNVRRETFSHTITLMPLALHQTGWFQGFNLFLLVPNSDARKAWIRQIRQHFSDSSRRFRLLYDNGDMANKWELAGDQIGQKGLAE